MNGPRRPAPLQVETFGNEVMMIRPLAARELNRALRRLVADQWRLDHIPANPLLRDLLRASEALAMSACPPIPSADVRKPGDLAESKSAVVSVRSEEAAGMWGIGDRQARRRIIELGGQKVRGAWQIDLKTAEAEQNRRREQA